jgi:AraC family transcriptional regulator, regulatory protein of adaptative response / methylated-DNA-[protein]-cysteine methyltransferase
MPEKELSPQWSKDYAVVEKIINYWTENPKSVSPLDTIAESFDLSALQFRELFSRWAGTSPERFLQYLSKTYTKKLLDTDYDFGIKEQRQDHKLSIHYEIIPPEEYKHKGEGRQIVYGFSPSPFGDCMIALTQRGICSLMFEGEAGKKNLIERLQAEWPKASLKMDNQKSQKFAEFIFLLSDEKSDTDLHLHIKDSYFNTKVWEALTLIPRGRLVSYQTIARHIRHPGAARAVGTAIGKNPISFVIPCHRVIRKNGEFGNYGGGPARKKAMIAWETGKKPEVVL